MIYFGFGICDLKFLQKVLILINMTGAKKKKLVKIFWTILVILISITMILWTIGPAFY